MFRTDCLLSIASLYLQSWTIQATIKVFYQIHLLSPSESHPIRFLIAASQHAYFRWPYNLLCWRLLTHHYNYWCHCHCHHLSNQPQMRVFSSFYENDGGYR